MASQPTVVRTVISMLPERLMLVSEKRASAGWQSTSLWSNLIRRLGDKRLATNIGWYRGMLKRLPSHSGREVFLFESASLQDRFAFDINNVRCICWTN